ncbi:NUDIX domain-containing protein [bacterium]|nr:NUDIX domain-containing protein [bacterium]
MAAAPRQEHEILSRKTLWQGHFRVEGLTVRFRRYDGSWSRPVTREVFARGHAAGVLLWDPARDEVVLVEQFRAPAIDASGGPWLLEVVAGAEEEGEAPGDLVRREALEEAGVVIGEPVPIVEYLTSPGGTSERFSLFCARVDATTAKGTHGNPGEHEDIKVVVLPFATALAMAEDGRIATASTIIALYWLARHKGRLAREWGGSP